MLEFGAERTTEESLHLDTKYSALGCVPEYQSGDIDDTFPIEE